METIRVVVQGASGKMGQEVCHALCHEPDTEVVGAIDLTVKDNFVLPDGYGAVPAFKDAKKALAKLKPNVLVDFSLSPATMPAVRAAIANGVHMVIGTTGLSKEELDEIDRLSLDGGVGAVVAPNFALGAIMMMHLAKIAAKYFDHAEIIEGHHQGKIDAPSGTALATAKGMAAARGKPFEAPPSPPGKDSRGQEVEGIPIHSLRLPGLLAQQEVIFGTAGQTLSIKHDTINRECFMPGVVLAVKEVGKYKGLAYGLEELLGLQE